MNLFRRFGVGAKIYAIVAFLSCVALVIALVAADALKTYERQVLAIDQAARRSTLGEQVNGLINAVVMDSRGVFMGRDKAEAERFAGPLLASLAQIKTRMAEWREVIGDAQRAEFDRAAQSAAKFIEFRTETVRISREQSIADARAYSDNDANRSNRQQFNKEVVQLAEANNTQILALRGDLARFNRDTLAVLAIVTLVGVVGAALLSTAIVRGMVVRPITRITKVMTRLAEGETGVEIPDVAQQDEIGAMARAVEVFKANSLRGIEMERARLADQQIQETRRQRTAVLAEGFGREIDGVVQGLSGASEQMHDSASSMTTIADRTAHRSGLVVTASEQASNNVQTVAAATEELAASIAEIGRQVTNSTSIAAEAVQQADRTNVMVNGLADAAGKIGQVVQLITAIASQTNLLALNATIEAARAGEAGKGFAVVASEVKNLATQTAKATNEIVQQISAIQSATHGSVEAIQAIGATIRQINDTAAGIAAAVEQQGAATAEIARNVQQAAESAGIVTSNISEVTRGAMETGQAASQVLEAAGALAAESTRLRMQVDSFVEKVTAA